MAVEQDSGALLFSRLTMGTRPLMPIVMSDPAVVHEMYVQSLDLKMKWMVYIGHRLPTRTNGGWAGVYVQV